MRVDLDALTETAVLREHWPQFLSHLFELGPGLLAATGWTGSTLMVAEVISEGNRRPFAS